MTPLSPTPPQPESPVLQWHESNEAFTLYYGTIRLGWIFNYPPGKWSTFGAQGKSSLSPTQTPEEAQRIVEQAALKFANSLSWALSERLAPPSKETPPKETP